MGKLKEEFLNKISNGFENFIEKIDESIRSCANCGFIQTKPRTLLCEYCFQVVMNRRAIKPNVMLYKANAIKTYSLFEWCPNECNALSTLALVLKGKAPEKTWQEYAALFVNFRMSLANLPDDPIFVPCASSTKSKDHAWYFARALSELTKSPLMPLLSRGDAHHFRKATKADREAHFESRFQFSENITQADYQKRNIIFVDDIITTGTTVKSAYASFQEAESFEAWSLLRRMK